MFPFVERLDATSIGYTREDLKEALANLRALHIMAESQRQDDSRGGIGCPGHLCGIMTMVGCSWKLTVLQPGCRPGPSRPEAWRGMPRTALGQRKEVQSGKECVVCLG